ncbi:hypothetical protein [Mesorhizobium salmacidum]|uniref:Uncharacterized protein n=1 Tax=Mesorhizobium salmacidum TaxID=3015171 RepID=A0ABU8KVP6_9HYPH
MTANKYRGQQRYRATRERPVQESVPGVVKASARMACKCLIDAQATLYNQGYHCSLLGEVLGFADTLLADRVGRDQPVIDVPEHIVEAAKIFRRAAGRSY